MPAEIITLFGYQGPNLHYPQPAVALRLKAAHNHAAFIRSALKDAGQRIGIVIGYLELDSIEQSGQWIIDVRFVTPAPEFGVELTRVVVAGLNAHEANDDTWDFDEALWDIQRRRRVEALPIQALQVIAEAENRGIPAFKRVDDKLQVGYGAHSVTLDIAPLRARAGRDTPPFGPAEQAQQILWDKLGPVPIIAVSGGAPSGQAAKTIANMLQSRSSHIVFADNASFEQTRTLLSNSDAQMVVVGLELESCVRFGLPFDRCLYAAVVGMPAQIPAHVVDRHELARILALPMLVAHEPGAVVINADEPELVALAEYAACDIIYISTQVHNAHIDAHCAAGGTGLIVREGRVIIVKGAHEQVLTEPLPESEWIETLTALAILQHIEVN
jgi:hypothetical protein